MKRCPGVSICKVWVSTVDQQQAYHYQVSIKNCLKFNFDKYLNAIWIKFMFADPHHAPKKPD